MHSVSIIIPVLNEAAEIESTLASASNQEGPLEIIVVDGGSKDGTIAIATRQAEVLQASRGRAIQMNCGASHARGDILLFLHADSRLPARGLQEIRGAVGQGYEGGAFRLKFDRETPLLRAYSFCTRFRTARFCFGDRGLFIRREVFEELGGFPETPLFEDLEMARLLSRRGSFAFLADAVTTSSRRFIRHGPFRQQLRNTYLWLHYLAGTDPHRLTHLYAYD